MDFPFVVEAGASSVAFIVVLAQKREDRKVQLIQFASLAMTRAPILHQRKRSARFLGRTEECLGLPTLGGAIFVKNNHQALQAVFEKRDIHGRFATWFDLMVGCDFEVK